MRIWKKVILSLAIIVITTMMSITGYYFFFGFSSSIGPTMNQVFLDFEVDLYRSSNGVLLLNDHTINKEIIANDRVRYELLLNYKTNPLVFSIKKNNLEKWVLS
jgi:hypothetical protein